MSMTTPAADTWRARIDARQAAVASGFAVQSPALGAAMRESILAPGKRFRGTLVMLAAEAMGRAGPAELELACAIEFAHSASLIIDDLPAMDDAGLRRGRPTTHNLHGESRAILAGIALVSEALRLLATAEAVPPAARGTLVAILAGAIGPSGLCAGQDLDLHGAKDAAAVRREQDLKTGALFAAGFAMLAVTQELAEDRAAALRDLGMVLGRAFQSWDDLLDASGAAVGKDSGRDGDTRGLMATGSEAEAREIYRALRADLGARLVASGLGGVAGYVAEVLPESA